MSSAFLLTPMQIGGINSLTVSPLSAPPQNPFVIRTGEVVSAVIFIPRNSSQTGFVGVTFTAPNLTNLNSQLSAVNSMDRSALDSRITSLSRELGLNVPIPTNVDEARNLAKSLISQYWYNQNQNRLIEAYSRNLNSPSFQFTPFVFGSSPTPTVTAPPLPIPIRTQESLSLLSGSSLDVVSRLSASGMFWNSILREPLLTPSEIQTLELILTRIDQRRTSLSQDAILSLNRTLGNGAPLMDAIAHDLPRNYSTSHASHFRRTSFAELLNEIYGVSSSLFTPAEQERIRSDLVAISSRELQTLSLAPIPVPRANPLTTTEQNNLRRQIVDQNRASIPSRTTRIAIVNLLIDLSRHVGFRSEFENDGDIINRIQADPNEFVESLRSLLPRLNLSPNDSSALGSRITNILRDLPAPAVEAEPTPTTAAPIARVYPTQVSDQTVSRLRERYGSSLGNNFDSFISILRELYPLPNGVVSGYFEDLVDPRFTRPPTPLSTLTTYLRSVVDSDRYPLTDVNRVRLRAEIAALSRPSAPTPVQIPPETLNQNTLENLRRVYSPALGSRTEELVSLVEDICIRDSSAIAVFNSTNFSRLNPTALFGLLDQRIAILTRDSSSLQSRLESLGAFVPRAFNSSEQTQLSALLSRTFSNQTLPNASRSELSDFLLRLSQERGFRAIVPNISALETQLNSGGFSGLFTFVSSLIPRLDSTNGASLTNEFNRIRTAIESRFSAPVTAPTPIVAPVPQTRQISTTLTPTERPIFDLIQRGNPRQLLERIQNGSLNSLSPESIDRLLLNVYQYAVSHPDSVLSDALERGVPVGDRLNDLDQSARLRSIGENLLPSLEDVGNLVSILRRLNLLGANDSISQNPRLLLLASAVLIWRDSHLVDRTAPGSWFETPQVPEVQIQLNPTQTTASQNVLSGNYSVLFAQRATLTDEVLRPVAQDISSRLRDTSNASPLAAAYRAYLSTRGSRFVSNGRVSDPIDALRNFVAYTVLNPTDRYSADSRALLSALHPPPSTIRNLTNPQSNLFDLVSSLAVMRWRDNNPNARNAPTPNFASELNPSAVVNVAPTTFARSAIDRDHQQILDDTFNGQQYRRILQARTSGFSDSTQNNVMVDVVYARISQSNETLPYTPRIAPAQALREAYSRLGLNAATTPLQKTEHLIRTIWEYARSGRNSGSELFCADAVALLTQTDPNSPLLQLFNRGTNPPSIAIPTDVQFASIAQGASLYQVFTLLSIAERRIRDRSSAFDYATELSALGFARPLVPRPTAPVAVVTPTTSAPTVSADSSIVEGFRFSGMDRHQYDQFDSSRYRVVPNLPQNISDQLGFVIGGEGNAASPYIVNIPVFSPLRPGQAAGEVLARTQSFEIPIGGIHVQFFYTYAGPNVQRPANYPQDPNALALGMVMNLRRNRALDSAALGRALNHDLATPLNSGETTLLNYLRSAHLTYVLNYPSLATTVFGPAVQTPSRVVVNPNAPTVETATHRGSREDPFVIRIPILGGSSIRPGTIQSDPLDVTHGGRTLYFRVIFDFRNQDPVTSTTFTTLVDANLAGSFRTALAFAGATVDRTNIYYYLNTLRNSLVRPVLDMNRAVLGRYIR